ncbi:hypothetical protein H0X48_00590 [Candidatus Dependentiae bacterium]|nr:hypothetical protein [Candidatus Dependentiae bacterium]
MIFKNIKLLALFCIGLNLLHAQEITLSPYAEHLSGGLLSPELESTSAQLFKDLAIAVVPMRKPSKCLIKFYPNVVYRVLYFKQFNCCYVDEEFFASLTYDEKRAALAYALHADKLSGEIFETKIETGLTLLTTQLAVAAGSYVALDYYFPKSSVELKAFGTWPLLLCSALVTGKRLVRLFENDDVLIDDSIGTKFNCKAGLLGLLKKQINIDPESSWLLSTNIHKRIAHLEKELIKGN